jgi:hypothetical protein
MTNKPSMTETILKTLREDLALALRAAAHHGCPKASATISAWHCPMDLSAI